MAGLAVALTMFWSQAWSCAEHGVAASAWSPAPCHPGSDLS